jgi:hypothetical protein
MSEQRKGTDKLMVVCTTLSAAFAVVLIVIGLQVVHYKMSEGEFVRKVIDVEPEALLALRDGQAAALADEVRWVDAERGVTGQPIDSAMDAVVAEHGGE